jgi:glutamyl-Q tRNA(Asp) synthetase
MTDATLFAVSTEVVFARTQRALAYKGMFVTRFAPSPTGYLHLGHALSAISAYEAAYEAGGRLLLRIEDLDATRIRPEFEAAIYEDLAWLGLTWETPVRRQSEHIQEYQSALNRLNSLGVLYRCFKTRKDLLGAIASAPHSTIAAYTGEPLSRDEEEAKLESGQAFAWRLSLSKSQQYLGTRWQELACEIDGHHVRINPSLAGDAIIARKEFPASYHLASVFDDALQGITHVIRGEDLIDAPHLHVLLQALLDLPTPIYRHHPLLLDRDGKRLAKRNQSATLRAMRSNNKSPEDVRSMIGLST